MNAPVSNQQLGIIDKYNVSRRDGRDSESGDRAGARYFVLDTTFDCHALPAIAAYAQSCEQAYPLLAADLRAIAAKQVATDNVFVTVPESTVSGVIVPAFQVGQYLVGKSVIDTPVINGNSQPWVDISYTEARSACVLAGMSLLTELQALAIAQDIVAQPINWTGGAVGEGKVFQGLHKGTVDEAQAGTFESPYAEERRWHELSNGERIYDFAGNAYSWIFDDVQGNPDGIVAKPFATVSPSIALAPYPSREFGMGWRPSAKADWSGGALMRGGYWSDGDRAGVFRLNYAYPGHRDDNVGFRCTKPA